MKAITKKTPIKKMTTGGMKTKTLSPMKKGGVLSKPKPIKRYEMGGAMDECAGMSMDDRKKKRCKSKSKSKGKSQETKGGLAGLFGGLVAGAGAAWWMKNQKQQ